MNGKINICRPGFGASCALCCGSHNYTLEPAEISALFKEEEREGKSEAPVYPKRFDDAIQCPHVGYTSGPEPVIGCLKYRESADSSDAFFNKTCKTFFCPASDHLTREEIIFAARLCADWYYYSLLIHEIELLKSLAKEFSDPAMMPPERLRALKERLKQGLLLP